MILKGNPAGFVHTSFFIPGCFFVVILYGVYVLGRQRRYLDAGVFSSSGDLV